MHKSINSSKSSAPSKYKAYPEYKDSGIEWLGDVPNHWKICRLKNLASIRNGQDYKTVQVESGYPVMGSGGQFAYASKFMYDKPSVLLGRKGTIDKPLYINEPFWTVDTMYYTEMNQGVDAKYLYYLALTIQFSRYSTNTALPSMTQEHLSNYYFSVPENEYERKQIANFLDHETAKIDTLIDKQQQLIKLLKEKRQAVISHAVTKGLNPNAPMKDSGVEWLGEVPAHWDVMQFRRITTLSQGLQIPQSERFYEQKEGCVEYITIKSLNAGSSLEHKEYIYKPSPRVVCDKNDVLLARTGATGDVVTNINGAFHNNFFKVKYSKHITKFFLVNLLTVKELKDHLLMLAGTTTIPDLNHGAFLSTKIALPSLEEQESICINIEVQNNLYMKMLDAANKQIGLLQERRTALISAAVTGKIDVRDWTSPQAATEANA